MFCAAIEFLSGLLVELGMMWHGDSTEFRGGSLSDRIVWFLSLRGECFRDKVGRWVSLRSLWWYCSVRDGDVLLCVVS